ncbi:MAG: methylated-DNA--[protein]-cysteine S-methyltransferase [Micrococcaceae bacterium]
MDTFYSTLNTPDGPFTMVVHQNKVVASGWTNDFNELMKYLPGYETPSKKKMHDIETAVLDYYSGNFDKILQVSVHTTSTPFTLRIWEALRKIPAGTVLSYTQLAKEAGNERATRAAGTACGKNPVSLFIPCHRALRSDGTLGGFGWGLNIKESLLSREKQAN